MEMLKESATILYFQLQPVVLTGNNLPGFISGNKAKLQKIEL
jgi:hypothetical protein